MKSSLESERNRLRYANEDLKRDRKRKLEMLASRRKEHHELGLQAAEWEAKCSSITIIQERLTIVQEEAVVAKQRADLEVAVPEIVGQAPVNQEMPDALPLPNFEVSRGGSAAQSTSKEFEIRVQTEYEERIRESLDRKRSNYQRQYENFIYNLEQDAAEIIGLYEKILKEKFIPGRLSGLQGIWEKRGYQERIEKLLRDIEEVKRRLDGHQDQEDDLKKWYDDQIANYNAQLAKLMDELKALFASFNEFTNTRYSLVNEVSIYRQLLDYEDKRMSEITTKVSVPVRKTTSRRLSHAANVSKAVAAMSKGKISSSRREQRESGYVSPMKTPEGTLERHHESHMESVRSSRSSVSGNSRRESRSRLSYESRESVGEPGAGGRSSAMSGKTDTLERLRDLVQ